jgi:alpha,alpha-trehalase
MENASKGSLEMEKQKPVDLRGLEAFVLDMDGVVTDTAAVHASAWKKMFDGFLEEYGEREGESLEPFDIEADYLAHVDGRPRYEGAAGFLESRGIDLPRGSEDDDPGTETVCGLGNLKNEYFQRILREEGARAIDSTVEFVERGRGLGMRFAVISASRNAERVLEAAGVTGLFDAVVGGREAQRLGLAGKPEPDIFLEAARRLGADPSAVGVAEDAEAGVRAGSRGGFALVVGVGPKSHETGLLEAGADIVVASLTDLLAGGRETAGAPSALAEKGRILARLDTGIPALFLDYDGTLTPIVDDPADATLPERARKVLEALSGVWPVAILSGRDLKDVRSMVGLDDIVYGGSHGFDIWGAPAELPGEIDQDALLAALDAAESEIAPTVRDVEGARAERKRFAIAVHYRQSPPDRVDELRRTVESVASSSPELRMTPGKKIFELRPDVDWHKGRALTSLLHSFGLDSDRVVPIYIGDDTTDEDAFDEIACRGIPILVTGGRASRTSAHYSLRDPEEVAAFLEELLRYSSRRKDGSQWMLEYEGYAPGREQLRETLCATGNGYFLTRGAAPQSRAGEHHYPGTYIGGCYNRRISHVAGHDIENESLVNMPNWLCLCAAPEGEGILCADDGEVLECRRQMDIARGVLTRTLRLRHGDGRVTRMVDRRFAHMGRRHLGGLELEVVPENWSGRITVTTAVDGNVSNAQVKRYQQLDNQHLDPVCRGAEGEMVWVQMETNQSGIRVAAAARTRVFVNGFAAGPQRRNLLEGGYAGQEMSLELERGDRLSIEKVAALYTSRDRGITESLLEARDEAGRSPSFGELLLEHTLGWQRLWDRCHIACSSDTEEVARILNLHILHLLQTVSVYSIGLDVGVPPRGLHGEAYRGLIMWDELFIFPFLDLRIPDLTRTLLLYRFRRMRRARIAAEEAGHRGAMFPWQSGSNGREEAQRLHLNPKSGHWIPDNSQLQRHINIAVAYNVWQHYEVTGDIDFLSFYGGEMIIEIARFWASIAHRSGKTGRYEIHGVMGPDEFHDAYPDADEPGLRNNAYTNVMVAWVMQRALDVLDILPPDRKRSIWESLSLTAREVDRWEEISRRMLVPFHGDGIISQFEGYGDLEEFDWEGHRERYGDIHRLDRILEAEGDSPNRYKVSKQADVLMLFFLLSHEELSGLFARLGYEFNGDTIARNVDYYLKRTSHGSTLSRVVHSWVLARMDRQRSWDLFCEALRSDVADIQGGTTHEGIHLGAMAGTVDLAARCYTGLETRRGVLRFDPRLPEEMDDVEFSIRYRRHWINVSLSADELVLSSRRHDVPPIRVAVAGETRTLESGTSLRFELDES